LPEYSMREIEGANGPSLSINRDPAKVEWTNDRRFNI
jgi:ribosomal protein L24E